MRRVSRRSAPADRSAPGSPGGEAAGLPMAELLLASGRELDTIARLLLALEAEMLGQVGRPGSAADTGTGLQQIDLVMQTVRDLARLMRLAARAAPDGCAVAPDQIDGALTLEQLRARIGGLSIPTDGTAMSSATTGSVELF